MSASCDGVFGRGVREGTMVLALLSACFQSLTPLPTSKLGPSGADSRVSGFVHSRTLWVSPMNCPVMLGVSPAAASTPTSVFNQWFEVLFPRAGALGCASCLTPQVFLLVYPQVNVGPPAPPAATLPQVLSARSLSLSRLLVWMNVSSLSPWLSDFQTV